MSSRALRRLQREGEEQKQRQYLREHEDVAEKKEEEEEEEEEPPTKKPINAFDILNDSREDEERTESQEEDSGDEKSQPVRDQSEQANVATLKAPRPKPKKSSKKNKKRAKEKGEKAGEVKNGCNKDSPLDEIDLALKSLSTRSASRPGSMLEATSLVDPAHAQLNRLLAVESKHLNALNEMKRLFGNVILENEDDGPGTPRRRGRGPQQLDLGGALTARNSPVARGQGLAGLALRRNFLIQGKEEWPKATGGGLVMELVEKLDDGTVEYRFVHNSIYQDVQRQFTTCVESMDPQRMISMLVYNPYHVSTLLQVSEIAKQQGDHSVSGDLLERALFTFGRSVHSSFTNALSEGKARLNFDRPENREFWLAAWRYMNNLGQRGTWRTAYEWAKLILSVDPELDPYCIHKVMDQIALRGGQPEHFLELSKCSALVYNEDVWQSCPNIVISTALAEFRLQRPQQCRASLKKSIDTYPWIFTRLFQELNQDGIPRSIWGITPRTPREKLDCESYVSMAKDLWNTPETISLLAEVASCATPPKSPTVDSRPITLDEARHALLSGIPAMIDCIPRSFTSQTTSFSDPFPPRENLSSYDASPGAGVGYHPEVTDNFLEAEDEDEDEDEMDESQLPPSLDHPEVDSATVPHADGDSFQSLFSRFIPWLRRSEAITGDNDASASPGPRNEIEAGFIDSARVASAPRIQAAEVQEQGNGILEVFGQAGILVRQGPDGQPRFLDVDEGSSHVVEESLAHLQEASQGGQNAEASPTIETSERAGEIEPVNTDRRPMTTTDVGPNSSRQMEDQARAREAAIANGQTQLAAAPTEHVNEAASDSTREAPSQTYQSTISDASEEEAEDHPAPAMPHEAAPYDDDRNQRWLAGQGMLQLKAYTTAHSTNPSHWPNDHKGEEILAEYATRILRLQRERSRRFILDYALRQGAGKEVGDLVEAEVARLKRDHAAVLS